LDETKWTHMVTANQNGNSEFQYYRNNRKNSYVEDGILKIKVTPVSDEYSDEVIRNGTIEEPGCNEEPCASVAGEDTVMPVFSAKLITQGKFYFTYGKVEVRAKIPDGDWLWPAIWMMPENSTYGDWPVCGEIDILESRGNRILNTPGGGPLGANLVQATLNWGPDMQHVYWPLTHWSIAGPFFSDDFHTYGVEWTPDYIKFIYDGYDIGQINPPDSGFWGLGNFNESEVGPNPWAEGSKMAPYDQPFYLILNVAVGGIDFDPDIINGVDGTRPWSFENGHPLRDFYEAQSTYLPTWKNSAMEVDYVRVWSL